MLDGEKVRAAMDALGLRGYKLAALVHMDPCTISKILNNDYHARVCCSECVDRSLKRRST